MTSISDFKESPAEFLAAKPWVRTRVQKARDWLCYKAFMTIPVSVSLSTRFGWSILPYVGNHAYADEVEQMFAELQAELNLIGEAAFIQKHSEPDEVESPW